MPEPPLPSGLGSHGNGSHMHNWLIICGEITKETLFLLLLLLLLWWVGRWGRGAWQRLKHCVQSFIINSRVEES